MISSAKADRLAYSEVTILRLIANTPNTAYHIDELVHGRRIVVHDGSL